MDVNVLGIRGKTVLMQACKLGYSDLTQTLITEGNANVNIQDHEGNTALIEACIHGNKQIVESLVDRGANFMNITNNKLDLSLMQEFNRTTLVRLAIDSKDLEINQSLMELSCKRGDLEIARILTKRNITFDNARCLYIAFENNQTPMVQFLIENDVSINSEYNRQIALAKACRSGNEQIVQLLIDAGAKLDVEDPNWGTAIMIACRSGNEQIVQLLINAGAKIDVETPNQDTALMIACRSGNEQIAQLLIDAGADLSLRDHNGINNLLRTYEAGHVEMAKRLINRYGDFIEIGNPLYFVQWWIAGDQNKIKKFIKNNIDAQDAEGKTALMLCAMSKKYEEAVKLLIRNNANLDIEDQSGNTALLLATQVDSGNIINLLIDGGASLDSKSSNAALMISCIYQKEFVRILLKNGINIDRSHGGQIEIMDMLEVARKADEFLDSTNEVNDEFLDSFEVDNEYDDIFISRITNKIIRNQNIDQYNRFKAYCEHYEFPTLDINQYLLSLSICLGTKYEGDDLRSKSEGEVTELLTFVKKIAKHNGISSYSSALEALNPELLPRMFITDITKLINEQLELFTGIEDDIKCQIERFDQPTYNLLFRDKEFSSTNSSDLSDEEYNSLTDFERAKLCSKDLDSVMCNKILTYYAEHPTEFERPGEYLTRKKSEGISNTAQPHLFDMCNPKKYILPTEIKIYVEEFMIEMHRLSALPEVTHNFDDVGTDTEISGIIETFRESNFDNFVEEVELWGETKELT